MVDIELNWVVEKLENARAQKRSTTSQPTSAGLADPWETFGGKKCAPPTKKKRKPARKSHRSKKRKGR